MQTKMSQMLNDSLETLLILELPSRQAEIDEVCISFYPSLNPELFDTKGHCANKTVQPDKTPSHKTGWRELDEHELALIN